MSSIEPIIVRGLNDKLYDKRKAAALDLEKLVRECHTSGDSHRINNIIDQLIDLFSSTTNPLHARNGGLIGLAAAAIALGVEVAVYMDKFIGPLLRCFDDSESRVRYFACESMYNIAKVSKGEILVYFNPIFDHLSRLAADAETSVKNGAELLDRLLKDIVAESAPVYFPQFPETEKARQKQDDAHKLKQDGVLVSQSEFPGARKAFSLANFIPLLAERIHVISPFSRSYLVSWITVLDSVPDLELVTYLPEFLDGLLKYLSDPTEDVKVATEGVLADFLHEIQEITLLQKRKEERARVAREALAAQSERAEENKTVPPGGDADNEQLSRGAFMPDGEAKPPIDATNKAPEGEAAHESGAWVPGQGVKVNHAAIVEILINQLDPSQDEIQQTTALGWISKFLEFAPEVVVPFTPRLTPAILPNLAHHIPAMQSAAALTNQKLFSLIQSLPSPSVASGGVVSSSAQSLRNAPSSPISSTPRATLTETTVPNDSSDKQQVQASKLRTTTLPGDAASVASGSAIELSQGSASRPHSPIPSALAEEPDPFDYQSTVNGLTIQFLSEHEETRIFALKWLIMLHQKAPKKILSMDDGTFPALLKTLSDTSEEVIKYDLQLLAQISSSSEEGYFKAFVVNLLELFSTDKGLLDNRGSLIIRQLCMSLNTERIYRTFAEILEREEDLEFASVMAQKLNIILITSPELSDFRKRLKNLESRDGQALFTTLYRSWCHNAVSLVTLCLLAQAYEHASNLLALFGELEITLQLLVQIDKLVQLIESPVFTSLRLQLLEPDRYPYLFKCLYGLLMILPQSSAFLSLSRRLGAVGSMGVQHMPPRASRTVATQVANRTKVTRDEIKWQELLSHFRAVQAKHEKARRRDLAIEPEFSFMDQTESDRSQPSSVRPNMRRKPSQPNDVPTGRPSGPLSPLNPKRGGILGSAISNASASGRPLSPTAAARDRGRKSTTPIVGNLPTGAFVASAGLESYIKHGHPDGSSSTAPESTINFMRDNLHSYAHSAIPFVQHANRIMDNYKATGDDTDALNRLLELDDLYDKMTLNHVSRRASKTQGVALLTLYSKGFSLPLVLRQPPGEAQPESEDKTSRLVDTLKLRIRQGCTPGHLPICWSVLTSGLELSSERSIEVHLFLYARSILSSAIRLNTLGPYSAQQLLLHIVKPLVRDITKSKFGSVTAAGISKIGTEEEGDEDTDGPANTWPLGEILAARHDLQHSRIFNS
ncbi:ARM repeat-containing protein [Rhizoctonia solani]|uniref:ARM repeat-containing protein n=1 Tax=Rhizoctonia solani TaxID=456999 RepID=A0A8H7II54_9AGAM|nr:ARM repeat-containing protein [Rhizoctonia solani]